MSAFNNLGGRSGDGRSGDYLYAMDLDPTGNVYLTGNPGVLRSHCLTVKFDGDGNFLWVARYPSGSGVQLITDQEENVYVSTFNINGYNGLAPIIKYDRNGTRLWVARLEPQGLGDYGFWQSALDSEGNVFATGSVGVGTPLAVVSRWVIAKFIQKAIPGMPAIVVAPATQAIAAGSDAVLSVQARGDLPLRYQW